MFRGLGILMKRQKAERKVSCSASGQLPKPAHLHLRPKRINKLIENENRHHQYYVDVTFPFLVEKRDKMNYCSMKAY